jgi:exodeoxyribonuclease V alpha subunit
MVDLPLMCKLVDAIAPQASLILLGDRDQLPSVETGDVLAALCDAAGDGLALPDELAAVASAALGVDVPVRRDADSPLVRVELAQSYRQSAALDIAPLAASIRDGDVDAAMQGLREAAYRGVAWRSGTDAALAAVTLEIALPAYRALAAADDPATALRLARRFRVLTAVRAGAAGSDALNAQMAVALQTSGARADEFFHGRLVMIRENNYRHGLYNGDVGVCWRDPSGVRVWFEVDGGLRSWLPAALPNHASAFALTVHKAQGSEFDDVLFALPERGSRVLSRELLYTGLTRARNALTLWGNEVVIAAAIARRAQRWSGLADRLRDA